jgi:O-antigen/teichoic acid export membrane protein
MSFFLHKYTILYIFKIILFFVLISDTLAYFFAPFRRFPKISRAPSDTSGTPWGFMGTQFRVTYIIGRAIAQALSRWVLAAVARVRALVRSYGICGG